MTYSSIYPFYYCPSSKHANEEANNSADCFDQVTALSSTEFNSNQWKAKNYYSHAGLGISHAADILVPKEPVAGLLPFSSAYGSTVGFNSGGLSSQVKVEEPELLHFDTLHPQGTMVYGTGPHNVDPTSQNLQCFSSHRKYSIESVPGLYRDTCSPFGNYPGDSSSLENSPQPYFGESEFISSPIIQSPKSTGSFLCLGDAVFQTSGAKEASTTMHQTGIVQQPSPVYPSSLVSNQQTFHLDSIPQHHPYYQDDLESHSPHQSDDYDKINHIFNYNLSVEPELQHAHESKKLLDDIRVKTEEHQPCLNHTESTPSGLSRSMAAGQRNKSSNRPPTSMMTTFSSRITSPSAKRYHCSICQKGFSRPSSLNTHMYSHTGEKPFQCPYEGCGRHFSVVSNLRRHTKIHNGKAN